MFLEVSKLRVDYDSFTAVSDLSFGIEAGQIYGLIGPNGAGKTSTIRVLATLLEPTQGDIRVDGVDLRDHPEKVHGLIGYMPDVSPLYDDLTVEETLHVFASAYRIPLAGRAEAIEQVITLCDLGAKRNWYVSTLSKGMRQRCLLAKTLLHDPKLLLLDEPANGLDPMARIELREILKSLAKMGKTILISSHILTELSDFCTAAGIMEKGRMVASGRTEEIAQALSPGLSFRVGLIAPDPRAADLVRAWPKVAEIKAEDSVVDFTINGTPDEAADLLKALID